MRFFSYILGIALILLGIYFLGKNIILPRLIPGGAVLRLISQLFHCALACLP